MTNYKDTIDGKNYEYFYDTNISSWTVLEINDDNEQVGTANYYNDKAQLLAAHKFTFTKDKRFECKKYQH